MFLRKILPILLLILSLSQFSAAQTGNQKLTKDVFGFLVDWEYTHPDSNYKYIRYDLLTHLACFPFKIDSLGKINAPDLVNSPTDPKGYPYLWPWNDVIDSCKVNNVKLLMSVIEIDTNIIHNVFTDEIIRGNFIADVLFIMDEYEFDGINIDFEPIGYSDRAEPVQNFLQILSDSVKSNFPGNEISFSSPIVNWGNWDFNALAESCDYLFVMGYNFFGFWSDPGPTAPLSGSWLNLTRSLNEDYGEAIQNNSEKLLLGLAYFGEHWQTATKEPRDTSNTYISYVPFRDLESYSAELDEQWDAFYGTSWYRWENDTTWNQIWIDNKKSLGYKYDLTIQKNMKGVGIWSLGLDGAKNDYWDLIDEKIGAGATGIEFANELPTEFVLKQNYPNPFNPSTRIDYYLPQQGSVKLEIYDMLGQRVVELVNSKKSMGWNSVTWDGKDNSGAELSSGMYVYQIRFGTTILSKKMVLMK
ncbi:MAG: T9SS type A sorting domain-containing protein [Bacteroidetes bacterium]|nr:T9SS type A sorting domain-containing protein [Bacteroidota bacterium]